MRTKRLNLRAKRDICAYFSGWFIVSLAPSLVKPIDVTQLKNTAYSVNDNPLDSMLLRAHHCDGLERQLSRVQDEINRN